MNKDILKIALPSIVSNITVPLLGLVDTAIVGHLGRTAFIGAIAVGGMIFNMIYWVFGFLRMGTGGFAAQAHGADRPEECQRILVRSLMVGLLAAAFLILLQGGISSAAFWWVEAEAEVEQHALSYFRILIWGAPAVLGLYSFNGWFLGRQNARYPMAIAILQNVVNIGVSLCLVMGLGMKVEGVAIGTLVAQYSGLFTAAWLYLSHYKGELRLTSFSHLWAGGVLGRFFAVNRDIVLRTLCLVAVTTAFTTIGAKQGDVVLAVNSLLMQLFLLFSYIMDGFAYAGEALGGRYFGAGDKGSLRRLTHRLFLFGAALSLLFTIIYMVGGNSLLRLLTDQVEVSQSAEAYLPYAMAIPFISFTAFLLDGLFIGCTDTRPMLIAMLCATAAFFGLSQLLTALGNHALWVAFLSYLFLRGAIQLLFWKKNL